MRPAEFLNSTVKDFTLNLNTDYRYLKTAYYVSTHAEVLGNPVIPTSQNIIDASRTPILLLKANKAHIPTLPFLVTSSIKQIMSELGFPVVVFPVNPFSYDGYKTASNRSALYRAVKSLSMHYKFSVCAQPLRGNMISFRSLFGKCEKNDVIAGISERVFKVFKLPVCKLHVQLVGSQAYLCGLQPLRIEELSPADMKNVSEEVSRFLNKVNA